MIKHSSGLPPRVPMSERARPLAPPPEPPPIPQSGPTTTSADKNDLLEQATRSILDVPMHAPPPGTGTAVDPATTPLPARKLFRAKGIDVVSYGSDPRALAEAGRSIAAVTTNPEIAAAMSREKVTLVVIPPDRRMTDLPEFAELRGTETFDGRLWDDVRGVGGLRLPDGRLAVGIPEENLTKSDADRFWGDYSVATHELAHVVMDYCISDSEFGEIRRLYDARKRAGLPFTDGYAAANHFEYFAQATNVYFGRNEGQGINDPQWLAANDPALYRKLAEVYPHTTAPGEPELVPVADTSPPRRRGLLDFLRGNRDPGE